MQGFLQQLDEVEPLPVVVEGQENRLAREVTRLQEENLQRATELETLRGDLEFAEDRAHRAHQRLRQLDEEVQGLRRQLREARENGEKLRSERRSRIKSERQSVEAQRELEKLKREYIKLDRRLQQMAQRLVQAEGGQAQRGPLAGVRFELDSLRQLEASRVLGTEGTVTAEELGRVRRRFAAVFHPDRVNQLPVWVRNLCDEVLAVVNEACDRMGK
jgi:vacuolar-type H+-ATPase subunit I/STV1